MVRHLGFLILLVRFFDAILVLGFVVDFAIGVSVAVDVGMVKVIRDRAFNEVGFVFITITGVVVLLCFLVVVFNVGVFEILFIDREFTGVNVVFVGGACAVVLLCVFVVAFDIGVLKFFIDRELVEAGVVLICVAGIFDLLCVAETDNVLILNIVARYDVLDLPVSLKGNDVLVETFFLPTVCDFVGKAVDNDAITGDTITIEVNVLRFVVGNIVGNFCDDLVLSIGFVDIVLLLVVPDNVNIWFVVFVFVPVD